jgi:crotonobetainyl-CoA:carnitine CoA-transferase CaiB-like acyl-CoA transferase
MIAELDTPDWGTVLVGGIPWHFSETVCSVTPPSRPGEHTTAVLETLGTQATRVTARPPC